MSMDLEKLGAPWWFAIVGAGFLLGAGAAAYTYENGKIPALEQQIALRDDQLSAEQADNAKNQKDLQAWSAAYKALAAQSPSAQKLIELTQSNEQLLQNNQQLTQWNSQWRAANDQLKAKLNDDERLAELKSQYAQASRNVINFTSGQCDGVDQSRCDLVPLALRKLKALEVQRDQLHAQVLDLQTKLLK
jgi:hypothetical protein